MTDSIQNQIATLEARLSAALAAQRAAEQAWRESQELNTRLIEASQDCIKVLDLEGRLLSMNAGGMRVLEICDFTPLCNSDWLEFWQGRDRVAARAAIDAALRGEVGRFLGFCPTLGGSPRWWDVVVVPVLGPQGEPEKLLATSRDVTEQTNAELELRRNAGMLQAIVEGTANYTGKDFFHSMVKYLAAAIPVKIAFVTECANREKTRARTLAFWDGKGLAEDFEYDVQHTTCEQVYAGEECFYARALQKLFPLETALVDLNAQSYIGLPLRNKQNELIGHLAVIDDTPMQEPRGNEVLRIFAARAGAELERLIAEAELRRALAEIQRLKNQLQAENVYLQEEIRSANNFDEIVGSSPALLALLRQIESAAPTDATVLILGETGTGKELIARALHNRSRRGQRPLVKVNCGAISAGLVESELFGHVKGAFTGALDKRVGRFELADGGTLFLDEVGELPPETQVKLLRVLQEGEFEPVGSSKTARVNVRIIAATNRKLEDEVRAGRFRADLFYRLNVLPLNVPPLRERPEDIPSLIAFFLARFAKKFGKAVTSVSQEMMQSLCAYAWPGNIRELQNIIERGVALAQGSVLNLQPGLAPQPSVTVHAETPVVVKTSNPAPIPQTSASLDDLQRQHILTVLKQTGGVIEGRRGAALILNLHPNTLRSRMKKLGIQRAHYTTA